MPIGLGVSLGIGGGKPATSSGAPPASGFANAYSLSFDGTHSGTTGAYLTCGTSTELDISGGGSLFMWLKATTTASSGDYEEPFYRRSGSSGWQIGSSKVGSNRKFWVYSTSTSSMITGTPGSWQLLGVTFSSGTLNLYTNDGTAGTGGATVTDTGFTINAYSGGEFIIGKHGALTTRFYTGLMDEVSFFDSALSASDVVTIYNGGSPGDLTSLNPVGWWRMGDSNPASAGSAVSTITDLGSGGNNATQSTAAQQPVISTDVP